MTIEVLRYEPTDAHCIPPDPRAGHVAQRIADAVRALDSRLTIEHFGSTSIPDCSGKGVVDLMLLYPHGCLQDAKVLLEQFGFQHQRTADPFPEDRPMRVGAVEFGGDVFRLHVHVLEEASPEVQGLRAFRERLIANVELRRKYEERKRAILARGIRDSVEYSRAKESFIQGVIGPSVDP